MNMQALMKQAQQMQNDMLKAKNEIDNMEFIGTNSFVTVKVDGKKKILSIKIDCSKEEIVDDVEMIEDMVTLAANSAFDQVDRVTEEKMGKFANIPGLL